MASKCGECAMTVTETGIQCVDCRLWYHYGCSQLPAYQLYIFEVSQRQYSCTKCSKMNDEFLKKYNSESSLLPTLHVKDSHITIADPEIQLKVIYADSGSHCNIEEDIHPQTTARNKKEFAVQAKPQQADKEIQASEGFGTFAEHFKEFKEGVISQQEKPFVKALDNFSKVHSNILDLEAQILKLLKDKEDLIRISAE